MTPGRREPRSETAPALGEAAKLAEEHLEAQIQLQRKKVFAMAARLVPGITADDVLNPHDYPALAHDQDFQFEDGVLAGLIQAQLSLRAEFRRREGEPLSK